MEKKTKSKKVLKIILLIILVLLVAIIALKIYSLKVLLKISDSMENYKKGNIAYRVTEKN